MINVFWDRIRRKLIFLIFGDDVFLLKDMWEKFFILDVAIFCKDIEWCGLGDLFYVD